MMSDRFLRSRILYGDDFCEKLSKAKVLVCGLGAVGGYALELLARMGVGSFILADCDVFDASNINRQIGALASTVGRRKTEVMRNRVLDINSDASVEIQDVFIDENSIKNLYEMRPDVVIDAIDTIESKILLMKEAQMYDICLVSSMGAARRKSIAHIKTAPLNKTYACPLASRIRKSLRQQNIKDDFLCVFSDEPLEKSSHVLSGAQGSKKVIGSSAIITSIFGITLADLAISEILKNDLR